MSNISKINNPPKPERTLRQMQPGDEGWTVPWAYNAKTETLDEKFPWRDEPGGTVDLFVRRDEAGQFELTFSNRQRGF